MGRGYINVRATGGAVASPFEEPTEKVQNVKWINSGFR
jgi:hypothetical protein